MDKPKIRFKGYTEVWEQRKLGDYCDMFNGDRSSKYPNAADMVSDGIPFINAGDLENGTVNLMTCNRISREKYNDLGGAKLQRGDIVYCLRGTLGKNAFIGNFDEGTVASSLVALRPKNIDGKYLYFILNSDIEYRQRIVRDEGAAQPNLSAKSVSEYIIPVPSRAEQQHISAYFSTLDHLITLHQSKCEGVKKLKKYMLQNMFPRNGSNIPKIRFDGFTDAWEQRKFGDLGSVSMCKRIFKEQTLTEGEIPFYKIGTFGGEADAFITRKLYEEYKEKFQYPEIGDILISASGTIGRTVEYTGEDAYFQDSNIVWFKHDERVDNLFLKCLFSVVKWSGIEGSTIKRLYNDNFLKTEFWIPSVEEQKKIGDYFDHLDHLITLHQRKLENLRILKKFMLEKMFV